MGTPFKLRNQSLFVMTEAPGGLYNSDQLKLLATLTDGDTAMVKVTEDQRIGLFVEEQHLDDVCKKLESVGLGMRHYKSGFQQPVSCLGEMCPEHLQDAMGSAMDLAESISETAAECGLSIGINGCARCCVPCHTLDISIVGDDAGYKVRIGGKSSEMPELGQFLAEGVPESEVVEKITIIVQLYNDHKQDDESLQDVIERCGMGAWVDALSPYSQDAAGDDDLVFEAPQADSTVGSENLGEDSVSLGEDLEVNLDEESVSLEDDLELSGGADDLSLGDDLEESVDADGLSLDDDMEESVDAGDLSLGDDLEESVDADDLSLDDDLEESVDADDFSLGDDLEESVDADDLSLDDDMEESVGADDLSLDDDMEESVDADDLSLGDDMEESVDADDLSLDDDLEESVGADDLSLGDDLEVGESKASSSDDEEDFEFAEESGDELSEGASGDAEPQLSEEDKELAEDLAEAAANPDMGECEEDFCEEMVTSSDSSAEQAYSEPEETAADDVDVSGAEDEARIEEELNADIEATSQLHGASAGVDVDEEQNEREQTLQLIENQQNIQKGRFSSIEKQGDGSVILSFHSGLKVKLQPQALSEDQEFKVDNCKVSIHLNEYGSVEIEVDGISISLPSLSEAS